jgi:hypothetical protein
MLAVPCIVAEQIPQRHGLFIFRMIYSALPFIFLNTFKKIMPTGMQCIQERYGNIDRNFLHITQHCPRSFFIRLYGRIVFCIAQLKADVRIHVAVCYMMHYLPAVPSAGAVRLFQLCRIQIYDRIFQCLSAVLQYQAAIPSAMLQRMAAPYISLSGISVLPLFRCCGHCLLYIF